jgi:Integrase core domain
MTSACAAAATSSSAQTRRAETAQLGHWIDDYNRQAPHSALGMRSPAEYRARLELRPYLSSGSARTSVSNEAADGRAPATAVISVESLLGTARSEARCEGV